MTRYSSGTNTLPTRFFFARHALLFAVVSAVLVITEFLLSTDWPLFWPLFAWTLIIAVHYFVAGAFDIDEDWTNDKIFDLKSRAYDFDHIRNIEKRVVERDSSVTHPLERTD